MIGHDSVSDQQLRRLIRHGAIRLAGHKPGMIYGSLRCQSGRRMLRANRVFFADEKEAKEAGFRPCGHCMKQAYRHWLHHQQ